jgi:hypothetical protein
VKLADFLGVPSVVKVNGSDLDLVADLQNPRDQLAALASATRIVAVTSELAERAVLLGLPRDRIDVVPNGGELEQASSACSALSWNNSAELLLASLEHAVENHSQEQARPSRRFPVAAAPESAEVRRMARVAMS